MSSSDRAAAPAPPTAAEYLFCAVLAGLLAAIGRWRLLPEVLSGGFPNPDSQMRLARLADILRAGAPVDAIARDQSGAGFVLHWSHLLDMLILLLAQPLRLLLPGTGPEAADAPLPAAVHWAAVAIGPLSAVALALAVLWAVAPFADRAWRWIAAPAVALAVPISTYAAPGIVHHHVLLAAVTAMAAGWAVRVPQRGAFAGWKLGLWAGAGIWLSPEAMPFTLLAVAGVGWLWLLAPRARGTGAPNPRRALLAIGPGMLAVLLPALAVDPGSGPGHRTALDHISFLFVALAVAVTAIACGLWALDRVALRPAPRAAGAAALAALGLALWLAAFPAVLGGTEGVVTDPQALIVFRHIDEMLPLAGPGDALRGLTGGAFALVVLALLAWRHRSPPLLYPVAVAALLLGLGVLHRRFCAYPATLGAAMLAVALSRITASPIGATLAGAGARIGCLILVLFLPSLPDLLLLRGGSGAVADAEAATAVSACPDRHIADLLAPYAGQVVLADTNDAPDLLYRTRVLTVGSLYLRAAPGAARLLAAWRAPGTTATEPDAVRATGAAFVLACTTAAPPDPAEARAADTLFVRLRHDDPPPWLQRVGRDAVGHVLYRVRP